MTTGADFWADVASDIWDSIPVMTKAEFVTHFTESIEEAQRQASGDAEPPANWCVCNWSKGPDGMKRHPVASCNADHSRHHPGHTVYKAGDPI